MKAYLFLALSLVCFVNVGNAQAHVCEGAYQRSKFVVVKPTKIKNAGNVVGYDGKPVYDDTGKLLSMDEWTGYSAFCPEFSRVKLVKVVNSLALKRSMITSPESTDEVRPIQNMDAVLSNFDVGNGILASDFQASDRTWSYSGDLKSNGGSARAKQRGFLPGNPDIRVQTVCTESTMDLMMTMRDFANSIDYRCSYTRVK